VLLEFISSFIGSVLSLQVDVGDLVDGLGGTLIEHFLGACSGTGGRAGCPTSAYTALGAAFSLEGYWVQADVLWQLRSTALGNWAPLLYVLAVTGGFIGIAIGAAPRNYMWWLMGPVIYDFLIFTMVPVSGVQWKIGQQPQNMKEVWRIAEPGLRNKNIMLASPNPLSGVPDNYDGSVSSGAARNTGPAYAGLIVTNLTGPGMDVHVSMVFLWYDQLISDTIQWLIHWTGVGIHLPTAGAIGGGGLGGIISVPWLGDLPGVHATNLPSHKAAAGITQGQWQELSKNKWSILESITASKLHNPDLRDAFVSFLSSECGDGLRQAIDMPRFIAASNASPKNLPDSVLKGGEPGDTPAQARLKRITKLRKELETVSIPTPTSLKDFLKEDDGLGSIKEFAAFFDSPQIEEIVLKSSSINCWRYLTLIVHGFRWEAGHAYHQIVRSQTDLQCTTSLIGSLLDGDWGGLGGIIWDWISGGGVTPKIEDHIVYVLFYGWDIKLVEEKEGLGGFGGFFNFGFTNELPDREDLKTYMKNMILVHMFRNEWAIAPQGINQRFAVGDSTTRFAETQARTVGQKSKFGEFHVWAQMIPYVQGVLLYLLAAAYPFACILIVVPGWHKTLFTWMSFYAWVKLWDLGFAIVESIEKTLWAMIGNSYDAKRINDQIMSMSNWGTVQVECENETGAAGCGLLLGASEDPCTIPSVTLDTSGGSSAAYGLMGWEDVLSVFDKMLLLATNLDYDIGNTYYIYVLAALYFAVPAATGQLVLGAKAGAAGMVSNMIGGSAGEAGKGASSGFTGDIQARAQANQATLGQEATAKSMRKHGLADAAIGAGNMATQGQIDSAAHKAMGQGAGLMSGQAARVMESEGSTIGTAQALLRAGRGLAGGTSASSGGGTGDSKIDAAKGAAASMGRGVGMLGALGASAADGMLSVEQNAIKQRGLNAQAGLAGVQAGHNVADFQASAAGQAYGMHGQRSGAHAQHAAAMDTWKQKRGFANQMGGATSAMGVLAGSFSPGEKPMEMNGLAMSGMLGGATQAKADFADPLKGSLFGSIGAHAGSIDSAYGGSAVSSAYTPKTLGDYANSAGSSVSSAFSGLYSGNWEGDKDWGGAIDNLKTLESQD